ncbi:hypothetical protein AVEN_235545-1 [Araneus ventricosus]|uniref:Uncharacterized protein n=1 Tax=Araneus ventricosus TaxID=182803 RepID=A0A4Y2LCG9_ARAVE|nr:hypothetical protein AVEN_235545-1 [Araneus ventricosus]
MSPDRSFLVAFTSPTLLVIAFSTKKGDTPWKVSFLDEIREITKNVGKLCRLKDESIRCPLKGPDFFSHTTMVNIQARRHRPPWSPTRDGSHGLWIFPASALTMVLTGTYTLRVTPRDSDHP